MSTPPLWLRRTLVIGASLLLVAAVLAFMTVWPMLCAAGVGLAFICAYPMYSILGFAGFLALVALDSLGSIIILAISAIALSMTWRYSSSAVGSSSSTAASAVTSLKEKK